MVVKKKAIFKKAVVRNLQAKKYESAKKRLTDAFRGIPKRPGGDGMIRLDPREWGGNGGFVDGPQIYDDMIRLDPRERGENGGFDQYRGALKQIMPMPGGPNGPLIKSPGFPTPGRGDGMIRLDPREWNGGFDNQMNRGKELFDKQLQGQPYVPGEVRGQGQVVGQAQYQHHQPYQPPVPGGVRGEGQVVGQAPQYQTHQPYQPPVPGGVRGEGQVVGQAPQYQTQQPYQPPAPGAMQRQTPYGGFKPPVQMPSIPRPPMSGGQKPMPMPQLPNPGMMKQMPMPNPKRNLIPRPIDPRYKMM